MHRCVREVLKLFQSACAMVHRYSPAIPEGTAAEHSQHERCVFVLCSSVSLTIHINNTHQYTSQSRAVVHGKAISVSVEGQGSKIQVKGQGQRDQN